MPEPLILAPCAAPLLESETDCALLILFQDGDPAPAESQADERKGASSRLVNEQVAPGSGFAWQEGYGVFSVSRSHVERVKAYVLDQEAHHAAGRTWPEWEETEETDEPAEAAPPGPQREPGHGSSGGP